MKIAFKQERNWIEVLPSIAFGWSTHRSLYIGWLFWNVIIDY